MKFNGIPEEKQFPGMIQVYCDDTSIETYQKNRKVPKKYENIISKITMETMFFCKKYKNLAEESGLEFEHFLLLGKIKNSVFYLKDAAVKMKGREYEFANDHLEAVGTELKITLYKE